MRTFDSKPGVLLVSFKGPTFMEDLAWVKDQPGRLFSKITSAWTIPANRSNVEALLGRGFVPIGKATTLVTPIVSRPALIDFPGIYAGLRPYQRTGVQWLKDHGGIGLLADEMGLGKTVQAATFLALARGDSRPVLIVCPASLKLNWQRELKKWANIDAVLVYGRSPSILPKARAYIINYEILGQYDPAAKAEELKAQAVAKTQGLKRKKQAIPIIGWVQYFDQLKLGGWIADEAHYLSVDTTIQTRAFIQIHNAIDRPWLNLPMTGTPMTSKPADMYTLLSLVAPHVFNNRWKFLMTYCGAKRGPFGWTFDGASKVKELHALLDACMLRRLKADVLTELPAKQRVVVPMELNTTAGKAYHDAGEAFRSWFKGVEKGGIAAEEGIHNLARLAYAAGRDSVIGWIKNFLESGEKLVVGAWYHTAIDDLRHVFGDMAVTVDGSVPSQERQGLVDRFQTDPKIRLFIGQIKAAGVGLTLTAASSIAVVEFGQTPGQHVQLEDRIHRIGQTAESVTAYYLLAAGTVHEDMMVSLESKNKLITAVLDKQDDAVFFETDSIIGGVLTSMKGKINE